MDATPPDGFVRPATGRAVPGVDGTPATGAADSGSAVESGPPSGADPMALEAIRAETAAWTGTTQELVLETIRRGILEGVLRPGTKLRQEELAAFFGTSRLPVREAIWVLEREGLLTAQPNRSVLVTSLDVDEIVEIYDLRVLFESHAVRLAVPLLTEHDVRDLRALFDAMTAAADPARLVVLRDRFYMRLFAVSGQSRLVNHIQRLRQEIWRSFQGNPPSHPAFHRQFFDAVLAGDADAAADALASHYVKVSAMLRRTLRSGDATGWREDGA